MRLPPRSLALIGLLQVYRRFQVSFLTVEEAKSFINSIQSVCPCKANTTSTAPLVGPKSLAHSQSMMPPTHTPPAAAPRPPIISRAVTSFPAGPPSDVEEPSSQTLPSQSSPTSTQRELYCSQPFQRQEWMPEPRSSQAPDPALPGLPVPVTNADSRPLHTLSMEELEPLVFDIIQQEGFCELVKQATVSKGCTHVIADGKSLWALEAYSLDIDVATEEIYCRSLFAPLSLPRQRCSLWSSRCCAGLTQDARERRLIDDIKTSSGPMLVSILSTDSWPARRRRRPPHPAPAVALRNP